MRAVGKAVACIPYAQNRTDEEGGLTILLCEVELDETRIRASLQYSVSGDFNEGVIRACRGTHLVRLTVYS